MKLKTYSDFFDQKFFESIIQTSGIKNSPKKSRVQNCVETILDFLAENDVFNWNQFLKMSPFDRQIVDRLIDSSLINISELKEVRFLIRIELSDRAQLLEYKNELESNEEYEKCALIVKKLSQK